MTTNARPCPCGGETYATCCEELHDGVRQATTAVELMRSRYSAYVRRNANYVFRTWHPRTRPTNVDDDSPVFTRLEILDVVDGGEDDTEGIVEFRAHFMDDGVTGELHERSRFTRKAGRWVYLDALPLE